MNSLRMHSCNLWRCANHKIVRILKSCHNMTSSIDSHNIQPKYRKIIIFLFGKSHCNEISGNFKDMSRCLLHLLSRQCEVHFGQKVQQSLMFYSFYSRIWGEEMTNKMLSGIQRSLLSYGRRFLLSSICLVPYNWEKEKISDMQLESSIQEFYTVRELCSATIFCKNCEKRKVVDKIIPQTEYCTCSGSVGYTDKTHQYDSWEPFIERENIIVWRRKNDSYSNLYSYKVYGAYDDMTLSAFMEVQLNTTFRSSWDSTALDLRVIDSHSDTNSDLIYWKVKFPNFFSNRDYVFKRRFKVDEAKGEVLIMSQLAQHDQLPEVEGVHRVKDYWSIMVLKANSSLNEPGMSYTLTYFDNPGTSLPSPVTNFIATTAFPDYLNRVYKAAKTLQRRFESGEDVYISLPSTLRYPKKFEAVEDLLPETGTQVVPANDRIIQDSVKVPLTFRKAVVDVLEGMEIVTPNLEEKTKFTSIVEKLVRVLELKKEKLLINKLEEKIKSKTKAFIEDSAKKKEESLKIMSEFEKKKSHYNHELQDERTVVLIKGLFKAINEVLEADKNRRIGRGLVDKETSNGNGFKNAIILKALNGFKNQETDHNSSVNTCTQPCDDNNSTMSTASQPLVTNEDLKDSQPMEKEITSSTEPMTKEVSSSTEPMTKEISLSSSGTHNTVVNNNDSISLVSKSTRVNEYSDDKNKCPCCACDDILQDKSFSSWFSFLLLSKWWWSNDDFCNTCICEHKQRNKQSKNNNLESNFDQSDFKINNFKKKEFLLSLLTTCNYYTVPYITSEDGIMNHFNHICLNKTHQTKFTTTVDSNQWYYFLPISLSCDLFVWFIESCIKEYI